MDIVIKNWYTGWLIKKRLKTEKDKFLRYLKEFKRVKEKGK